MNPPMTTQTLRRSAFTASTRMKIQPRECAVCLKIPINKNKPSLLNCKLGCFIRYLFSVSVVSLCSSSRLKHINTPIPITTTVSPAPSIIIQVFFSEISGACVSL